MKLVNSHQMQALDKRTIVDLGIEGLILMENAGKGMTDAICERWSPANGLSVAIICGKGNNGGDGLVIARHLYMRKATVKVFLLSEPDGISKDAKRNLDIYVKLGGEWTTVKTASELKKASNDFSGFDLIVDAIFGTGLDQPIKGRYVDIIELINSSGLPVVAVDIPSGLSADLPSPIGIHVKADLTCTFGLPKVGNYCYPNRRHIGELVIIDIGIPPQYIAESGCEAKIVEKEQFKGLLAKRHADSHKGNFGRLLISAGSPGFTGAAVMTAEAAAMMGTGLVTVAVPEALNPILESKLTEVMTLPVSQGKDGTFDEQSADAVIDSAHRATALALGPGIAACEPVRRFVEKVLSTIELPTVVDADGLNCISELDDLINRRWERLDPQKAPLILTPHPGEMARLTGMPVSEIQSNRIKVARDYAKNQQVILVLKGAQTLIASPDGDCYLNPTGNPGMAKGGMGDILTGIIAGLLAQGISALDSAIFGVYLHGYLGDLAEEDYGQLPMTATDLLEYMPEGLEELL